jgi:hypothetical protein
MMTDYYENMSNDTQSFDWKTLPPGQYKTVGDDIVPVHDTKADSECAADNFISVLSRLTT